MTIFKIFELILGGVLVIFAAINAWHGVYPRATYDLLLGFILLELATIKRPYEL